MNLETLGWGPFFEAEFTEYKDEGYAVGRVSLEHKRLYRVLTESDEVLAEVSGKYRFHATERGDFPSVGDWVVLSVRPEEGKATIHATLPRKSKFSRKVAGNTMEEQ